MNRGSSDMRPSSANVAHFTGTGLLSRNSAVVSGAADQRVRHILRADRDCLCFHAKNMLRAGRAQRSRRRKCSHRRLAPYTARPAHRPSKEARNSVPRSERQAVAGSRGIAGKGIFAGRSPGGNSASRAIISSRRYPHTVRDGTS